LNNKSVSSILFNCHSILLSTLSGKLTSLAHLLTIAACYKTFGNNFALDDKYVHVKGVKYSMLNENLLGILLS